MDLSNYSAAIIGALTYRFKNVPEELKQTVTLDNGPENRDWKKIQQLTGTKCFFAHSYHSWERGTNENSNALIRDYWLTVCTSPYGGACAT